MNRRQLFVEGYKAGYKKALKERAYSTGGYAAVAAANRQEKEYSAKQAEKYGQPHDGKLESFELPVHVEYGIKNRRVAAREQGRSYPMLRLTTRGAWVPGIWSKGHYEKASSSYYYDPELAGLRPSDEASIIKCDNYGYPRFLLWAIYNYMSEIKTYDNTHNTGYKLSKVAAKYAAMIINQILKQVPEGKGEADFIVKVPYRVGRDNVSGKVFYMDEKDFPAFANKVRQA